METKSIKLDKAAYGDYVQGKEVACSVAAASDRMLKEGDHIMVYRDDVTSNTTVTPPKSDMQSEYIGIEGMVVRADAPGSGRPEIHIRKL